MDKDNLIDQPDTDCLVRPIFRHVHYHTEFVTQILQALLASVQVIHLEAAQEQFDAVGQESVFIVLHHDTFENLLVRGRYESLEDQHDGDDIFLFPPTEPEHCATVRQVMERVRNACLVGAYTTDLNGIWGV